MTTTTFALTDSVKAEFLPLPGPLRVGAFEKEEKGRKREEDPEKKSKLPSLKNNLARGGAHMKFANFLEKDFFYFLKLIVR